MDQSRAAAGVMVRRPLRRSSCGPVWGALLGAVMLFQEGASGHASEFQRAARGEGGVPLTRIPLDYGIAEEDRHRILQDTSAYQPIRMTFDTRVLDSLYGVGNSDVDGKIDFIRQDILPAMQAKWSRHLWVRPVTSAIPVGIDSCFGEYASLLNGTVAYDQTDLVVVVGGDPGGLCNDGGGTLAYAFPCGLDSVTDRPIVGTFNFCLNTITTSEIIGGPNTILESLGGEDLPLYYSVYTNQKFQRDRLGISLKDVAVHELTHILGFSFLLYPFFRDDDGNPRTARDSSGDPIPQQRTCGNGTVITGVLPSENVIQVTMSPWDASRFQHFIVTDRVRTLTHMQFNCSSLIGARLEDSDNCYGSHWHERDFYGELLSPVVSEGTENVLSFLTLAFLEDTGWYLVDCTWRWSSCGWPCCTLLFSQGIH
jgi:Leishmanolysin